MLYGFILLRATIFDVVNSHSLIYTLCFKTQAERGGNSGNKKEKLGLRIKDIGNKGQKGKHYIVFVDY